MEMLAALRARLAESEQDVLREGAEALSSLTARRDELHQHLESEHKALDALKNAHAAAIDERRAAHEQTLSSLHESVRARVAEKEQELQTVRNALETKRLRSEHIQRLYDKYTQKPTDTAAPAEARAATLWCGWLSRSQLSGSCMAAEIRP